MSISGAAVPWGDPGWDLSLPVPHPHPAELHEHLCSVG